MCVLFTQSYSCAAQCAASFFHNNQGIIDMPTTKTTVGRAKQKTRSCSACYRTSFVHPRYATIEGQNGLLGTNIPQGDTKGQYLYRPEQGNNPISYHMIASNSRTIVPSAGPHTKHKDSDCAPDVGVKTSTLGPIPATQVAFVRWCTQAFRGAKGTRDDDRCRILGQDGREMGRGMTEKDQSNCTGDWGEWTRRPCEQGRGYRYSRNGHAEIRIPSSAP